MNENELKKYIEEHEPKDCEFCNSKIFWDHKFVERGIDHAQPLCFDHYIKMVDDSGKIILRNYFPTFVDWEFANYFEFTSLKDLPELNDGGRYIYSDNLIMRMNRDNSEWAVRYVCSIKDIDRFMSFCKNLGMERFEDIDKKM